MSRANEAHPDFFEQRQSFYLNPSQTARGAVVFCIVIGVISIALGMYTGHQQRVWGAILFNTFFFFALALGGAAFSAMQDVLGAKWGRPVMRIHESFSSFLPVAVGIFLLTLICVKLGIGGARNVWSWIADPETLHHFWGKRTWLSENFWLLRDTAAMFIILGVVRWQIGLKTARDRAFAAGDRATATRLGEEAKTKLRYWSAPILVTYAVTFSLLGFDLLMSLAPTWLSTLFGGWLFAIMMQTLMATLLISMWIFKGSSIGSVIQRQQFHDVGKLMHGFSVFFAYLTYSHVLTYWYGNMPEETEYFIHRLESPWIYIVIGAPILSFLIPLYSLIPKASKWTKMIGGPIACGILFGQWCTYLLVVQPEVVKSAMTLPWIEIGLFFGVLGLFLISVFTFGKRNPMVSLADPLLIESLAGTH
ncbi:MAG: hypothetical protein NTV34_06780 [Proteobacteria bacterium]|nr:hypothetical protein [Pseudomonadota bacterium]